MYGIIPAYAGSTLKDHRTVVFLPGSSPHTRGARSMHSATSLGCRDHPRIRGEHHKRPRRARGRRGIIPAYAGSTSSVHSEWSIESGSSPHTRGAPPSIHPNGQTYEDHPRIRGEHQYGFIEILQGGRIIPAYAGSTERRTLRNVDLPGSSPHTRGAPERRGPNPSP